MFNITFSVDYNYWLKSFYTALSVEAHILNSFCGCISYFKCNNILVSATISKLGIVGCLGKLIIKLVAVLTIRIHTYL